MASEPPADPACLDVAEGFKTAFRGHPAGIALVTADTPAGRVGITVSSLASVSVDPVAFSFSVTRRTGSAGGILAADTFSAHLLDASEVGLAREFARPGGERFTPDQDWGEFPTGEPLLTGARASFRCRRLQVADVGESSLVVAEVLGLHLEEQSEPMVYRDRTFSRLGADLQ